MAKDGTVLTGRCMDWGEDSKSNMWALPRGMKRDGMGGKNSISLESRQGSLIVSGYDIGTSEGMNGDSAVFEYVAGKLVIHHGKAYKVLTSPGSRRLSGGP